MKKIRVFVYGTLRKGLTFGDALDRAELLGNGETKDKFGFFHYRYPAALIMSSDVHIKGELYLVDAETLKDLDAIEGHPEFYRRRPVYIRMEDGTETNAYMYFLVLGEDEAEKQGIKIESGDFIKFYKNYFNQEPSVLRR